MMVNTLLAATLSSDLLNSLPLGPTIAAVVVVVALTLLYMRSANAKKESLSEALKTVGTGQMPLPSDAKNISIEPTVAEGLSDDVIAAITAAIAATLQSSTSRIVIKNIKPVGQVQPIWSLLGRTELINSRF